MNKFSDCLEYLPSNVYQLSDLQGPDGYFDTQQKKSSNKHIYVRCLLFHPQQNCRILISVQTRSSITTRQLIYFTKYSIINHSLHTQFCLFRQPYRSVFNKNFINSFLYVGRDSGLSYKSIAITYSCNQRKLKRSLFLVIPIA